MKLAWKWFLFVVLGWYSSERKALSVVVAPLLRYLWSLPVGLLGRIRMASARLKCYDCDRLFWREFDVPNRVKSEVWGICPQCFECDRETSARLTGEQLDALAELIRKT